MTPRAMVRFAVLVAVAVGAVWPANAQESIPAPFREIAESYLPKAIKTPLGLYRRTEKIFRNHADCVAQGGTETECLAWPILCDLQSQAVGTYMDRAFGAFGRHAPTIAGQLMIFESFKTSSCGDDCFYCCLTPTGCHSSFGPSPVINCNAGYGEGTHTIGRTLITENPTGTNVCLAIPQTCEAYSECVIAGAGGYPDGLPIAPSPYDPRPLWTYGYVTPRVEPFPPITVCDLPSDWLPPGGDPSLDPSPGTNDELRAAIGDRKARYVAESVVRKTQQVLDGLPADYPLDELSDLISLRGCVGHRHLVEFGEPFDGTHALFPVTTGTPEIQDLAGARRALVFLAALRVLGGVPNFYNRLVYVESRMWSCPDREAYLLAAGIDDPDGELLKTMSPLALAILKQIDGLQDYRLLAVPLAGEVPATGMHNGCPLGTAPEVTLSSAAEGDEVVLTVSAVDPDAVDAISALPVAIDWGDGTTEAGELPVASPAAAFRHRYRAAGRYAAMAAVAGQSGLRGVAGLIVEAPIGDPAAPRPLGVWRVLFPGVRVFASATGNSNAGTIGVTLDLEETTGPLAIGRTPRQTIVIAGLTELGDLAGYNHDRSPGSRLVLRPSQLGGTVWDGREIQLLVGDLTLDLYSPQLGAGASKPVTLTAGDLRVYYADQLDTPDDVVTVDPDGTLRIPLVPPRSTAPRVPVLDRIEIDLAPLLADVDLGEPDLAAFPPGVRRRWTEVRPGELLAGPLEGLPGPDAGPPDANPTDTDPPDSCGCSTRAPTTTGRLGATALFVLAVGLLARRRR